MFWTITLLCIGSALAIPLDQVPKDQEEYPEENEGLFEGDIELRVGQDPRDRNAQRSERYKWPNGEVPFVIDTHRFSSSEQKTLQLAMQTISDKTKVNGKPCITFKPRTNEAAYIRYQGGSGCHTPVGYHHGLSGVTLGTGCMRIGTVMHETMHALGFWHEQSRPDRDSFVTIEWSNIQSGREHNFDKYSNTQVNTFGIEYDYESVMHYNAYSFAKDRSKPTISVKQRGAVIGQRTHLSQRDVEEIQVYYGCLASPSGHYTTPKPTTMSPVQAAETCTFQKDFCSWQNVGGDTMEWTRRHGSTPSANTGPSADHSGSSSGYYAYLESSGHQNKKAYLLSQQLPPGDYCFGIYYHMYGSTMGSLKVEVVVGNTRKVIHTVSGNQGTAWHHYLLNLHVPNANFKIEIEGDTGNGYHSDIAIDDLSIHNGRCTAGKRDIQADYFEI